MSVPFCPRRRLDNGVSCCAHAFDAHNAFVHECQDNSLVLGNPHVQRVLTNCAAKGATLEVLTTRKAWHSGSSDPSGIDSVKFREDSDGVLSFSQLFYGLDFFCICDSVFWLKCNPDQVFPVHQGLLYGPDALGGGPGAMFMKYMHHGAPNIGFWPHMHALRAWNRDEYRGHSWLVLHP